MLSRETLETYRRMTPGQRLKLAMEMSDAAWRDLCQGPPEVVRRRFELLHLQNEDRTRRILEGLARLSEDRP